MIGTTCILQRQQSAESLKNHPGKRARGRRVARFRSLELHDGATCRLILAFLEASITDPLRRRISISGARARALENAESFYLIHSCLSERWCVDAANPSSFIKHDRFGKAK